MQIAMLGTGSVGRTLGAALVRAGHQVVLGSRTAGGDTATGWVRGVGDGASEGTFATAVAGAEVVVNATAGTASLDVLAACAPDDLDGVVLLDVANPLDFSAGFPPSLAPMPNGSLAESLQAAHPRARVVKAFSTTAVEVMVDPGAVPGDHILPIAGDDGAAKAVVRGIAADLGWRPGQLIDLGGLQAAGAMEMWLPLWIRLYGHVGHPQFNLALPTAADPTPRS